MGLVVRPLLFVGGLLAAPFLAPDSPGFLVAQGMFGAAALAVLVGVAALVRRG